MEPTDHRADRRRRLAAARSGRGAVAGSPAVAGNRSAAHAKPGARVGAPGCTLRPGARAGPRQRDRLFADCPRAGRSAPGNRQIVLWNYQTGQRERTYRGFARSVGHVAFTSGGCMAAGERTQGDRPCAILRLAGWRRRPPAIRTEPSSARYASSVTALSPGAERARARRRARRRRLALRHCRAGAPWRAAPTTTGRAGSRLGRRGDWAVLLHERLTLVRLPTLEPVDDRAERSRTGRCGAFAANGSSLYIGRADGRPTRWEFEGDQIGGLRQEWPSHGRPVRADTGARRPRTSYCRAPIPRRDPAKHREVAAGTQES